MGRKAKSTNEQLRKLVEASGLTQASALEVFNRDLGPGAYSLSTFKAFLTDRSSARFRELKPELLEHAKRQFAFVAAA